MSTKSNPEQQQLQNAQQEEKNLEQNAQENFSSVQQSLEGFWQIIRKSADIIVTLRQENEILQSQNQVLYKSEEHLQSTVQDLLERLEAAEQQNKVIPFSTDLKLATPPEAQPAQPNPSIDRTEDLNDLIEAREELIRLEAIVQKYRTAGLSHIEADTTDDQLAMFHGVSKAIADAQAKGATGILTKDEALQLANQLDNLADQLQKLFDIS
ncbi:MAG: hypothetical protein HQ472_08440 [Ignavibacteria bacterium]|nr:hypothetical protein [Ignavibacteria bacterium]